MMDLKPEKTEHKDAIDVNGDSLTGGKMICCFCQTTKTPLWRQGPSGPKSLCNACGIKYNKKRRAAMGFERGRKSEKTMMKMKKKNRSHCSGGNKMRVRETLKLRLKELEREMVLQRSNRDKSQKLGEEERAAILLMALSYGYVYA